MEEETTTLKESIQEMTKANKEVMEFLKKETSQPKPWMAGIFGWKMRMGKKKLKKGYALVQVINENRELDFVKQPIVDGTIKLGETFHALRDLDVYTYRNKPLIMQPKWQLNPFDPIGGKHETYGQKYIMARMTNEAIKPKGFGANTGWIIFAFVIIAVIGYYFTGGSI